MGSIIVQPVTVALQVSLADVPADRAEAVVDLNGAAVGVAAVVMPTSGEIFAYGITLSELATAGTLLTRAQVNNFPLTSRANMGVAASLTQATFRVTDDDRFFQPGETVGILVQSVALAPITIELGVTLYVILNRGVSVDSE